MAKRSKAAPNKAKSIIAQPLFRCRQERPEKGKGSYRREAFQSKSWEASCFMGPPKSPLQALHLVIAIAA